MGIIGSVCVMLGLKRERTYEAGYRDGIERTLCAIDGSEDSELAYAGPVPPELTEWVAAVRVRLGQ